MFIETGALVFLSLMIVTWWLPTRTLLWLFGHPVWLEIPFGVMAYVLHYGTFSGMMAAATACVFAAAYTRGGKKLVGYINGGSYQPGYFALRGIS